MENSLGYIFEFFFKKRTKRQKVKERRRQFYRSRKTNFPRIKPKKGYVRLRIPRTNRYVLFRQTSSQKYAKHRLGKALGKATYLRKNPLRMRRTL
jgi:hypothetical protein